MSSPITFQCVKPTKLSWTGSITTSDGRVTTHKDAVLPSSSPLARLAHGAHVTCKKHGCVGSSIKTDTTITHMGKTLTINGTLTAM